MYDRFGRQITYLRISVTDRCNLSCSYCKTTHVQYLPQSLILSFEEIQDVVRIGAQLGITKIRLTGGEPLLRKDITQLIRMIKNVPAIEDLGLTTNGIFLASMAQQLYDAGLRRLNISLDTLDREEFRRLTGSASLDDVLTGIQVARKVGFHPIKINAVLWSDDETKKQMLRRFCNENNLELRFIRMMDLEKGIFSIVEGGQGGNCAQCNRLRLTADGYLKPCLFSDIGFSIREWGIEKAFRLAIQYKPEKGTFCLTHKFYNIGG